MSEHQVHPESKERTAGWSFIGLILVVPMTIILDSLFDLGMRSDSRHEVGFGLADAFLLVGAVGVGVLFVMEVRRASRLLELAVIALAFGCAFLALDDRGSVFSVACIGVSAFAAVRVLLLLIGRKKRSLVS